MRVAKVLICAVGFNSAALEVQAAKPLEDSPVYRCPGPPVLYSDALTIEEARTRGCKRIEGTPVQVAPTLAQPRPTAPPTNPPKWSREQIRQIEQMAQSIAAQHNANAKATLDDMTVSSSATSSGRSVRFEYVLRVQKGLSIGKLRELADELQREIVPKTCAANAKSLAFTERGLFYVFAYKNTYGERLADFSVDQSMCPVGR